MIFVIRQNLLFCFKLLIGYHFRLFLIIWLCADLEFALSQATLVDFIILKILYHCLLNCLNS